MRTELSDYTRWVGDGRELASEAVEGVVDELVREDIPSDTKADFLMALSRKGETADEIAAFALALRARAVPFPLEPREREGILLDVCGTGGDHLGTFNISTTVALVSAAAGVPVVKHGNRAITSQAGSADVLVALGIATDLDPAAGVDQWRRHGFTFLFAPRYHPAFRHLAEARKLCAAQGFRTLFNFLGPLLNPARPTAQLVGVSVPDRVEPLARTLQRMGVRRAMVVSGDVPGGRHLDELSIFGNNRIAEFYQERGFHCGDWSPEDFPLTPGATLADLEGGDAQANARRVERVLRGEDRGPGRDAVLLNAAAALQVAGKVPSMVDGWELAVQVIDSGAAWEKVSALRQG